MISVRFHSFIFLQESDQLKLNSLKLSFVTIVSFFKTKVMREKDIEAQRTKTIYENYFSLMLEIHFYLLKI